MIYGWDISTSIIGASSFDDLGRYEGSSHLDLRKIKGDVFEKADLTRQFVTRFLSGHNDVRHLHFVEDRLANFAKGRTMLQTLLKLAGFNMVVSQIVREESSQVCAEMRMWHVHPSTVKALMKNEGLIIPKGSDKKKLTLQFVRSREQSFPYQENRNGKAQPWCYDMADSYIIARAGMRKHKVI